MNKFSFKGLADQARSAGTKLASAGGFEQLQGLQAFRRTGVVRSTLHTTISCSAYAGGTLQMAQMGLASRPQMTPCQEWTVRLWLSCHRRKRLLCYRSRTRSCEPPCRRSVRR